MTSYGVKIKFWNMYFLCLNSEPMVKSLQDENLKTNQTQPFSSKSNKKIKKKMQKSKL